MATLNGAAALFGFVASVREKQLVAFSLIVSFAVIMSAEFTQGPRQRALAEQDQPRQALLIGRADPTFRKSVQARMVSGLAMQATSRSTLRPRCLLGFTGRKDPHIHLYMLELARKNKFQFDTVQMPVNVMDAHFRSFAKLVIPEAQKMGSSVVLKSNTVTAVECVRYSLSQPGSVVITGIDSQKVLD